MIQLFYKKDGAISIFLTIILVPVLIISLLFVDASRVQLARGVVASDGDLTMNTMLTQYDATLNDFYGLMATSQSISDFKSKANDYFEACFKSAGYENSTGLKYVSDLMDAITGEGDVSDFLKMTTNQSFTVSSVSNGSLENSALVKKEIVEFMKYRAPIDALEEITKKLSTASEKLKDSKKDTDLVDKKQDYYTAQGELTRAAYEVYKAMLDYEKVQLSDKDVKEMKSYLDSVQDIYKECHIKMFKDLYNTGGLTKLNYNIGSITGASSYDSSKVSTKFKGYLNDSARSISDFVSQARSFENSMNDIQSSDGAYDMQLWVRDYNTVTSGNSLKNFYTKAKSMIQNMNRLKKTHDLLTDKDKNKSFSMSAYTDVSDSGDNTWEGHYQAQLAQYNELYTQYFGNGSKYREVWDEISRLQTNCWSWKDTSGTNSRISGVYNKLAGYLSKIQKADDAAKTVATKLDGLKSAMSTCDNAFGSWKSAANSSNSEVATQDKKEIEDLDADIRKNVTSDTLSDLTNRFNNVRSLYGNLKSGIKGYKYNGTSVTSIDCYATFKSKSGINVNKIVLNATQLQSNAESSFKFTISDTLSKTNVTDNNNPDVAKKNTPKLYQWLKDKFKDYNEEDSKKKEQKYKDEKSKNETAASGESISSSASKNDISTRGQSDNTVDSSKVFLTDLSTISNNISTLVDGLSRLANDPLTTCRDDLYTLDYVFNMFSWDTYDKEGQYKLKNGIIDGTSWTDTDVKFSDNKSLTNKMVNASNNWAFGNEVEYILYGKSNSANKTEAYAKIFLLRFVTNLVPMMLRYMNSANASKPDVELLIDTGTVIEGATCGIVPEMLFRVVVTLGLTIMETVNDINYLKDGKPVKLIKDQDEIECTYGTLGKYTRKESDYKDSGIYYSDYLKIFLFLRLISDEYGVYGRIGKTIEASMDEIHEKDEGFELAKAEVYLKGTASVRVPALFMSIPFVTNNGKNLTDGGWNTIKYTSIRGY